MTKEAEVGDRYTRQGREDHHLRRLRRADQGHRRPAAHLEREARRAGRARSRTSSARATSSTSPWSRSTSERGRIGLRLSDDPSIEGKSRRGARRRSAPATRRWAAAAAATAAAAGAAAAVASATAAAVAAASATAAADAAEPLTETLPEGVELTELDSRPPGRHRGGALGALGRPRPLGPDGSRDETPAQAGVSHFLEHLLFKGTERYSAIEISEHLRRHGRRGQRGDRQGVDAPLRALPRRAHRGGVRPARRDAARPDLPARSTPSARSCSRRSRCTRTSLRTGSTTCSPRRSSATTRSAAGCSASAEVIGSIPVPDIAAYHDARYTGAQHRRRRGRQPRARRDRRARRAARSQPPAGGDADAAPTAPPSDGAQVCASTRRRPSSTTSASAARASRAATSAASRSASSTRSSAARAPRGCSARSARSAASPTPSAPTPQQYVDSGTGRACTSAPARTTSTRPARSSAASSRSLRDRRRRRRRARARQGARQGPDGARARVDRARGWARLARGRSCSTCRCSRSTRCSSEIDAVDRRRGRRARRASSTTRGRSRRPASAPTRTASAAAAPVRERSDARRGMIRVAVSGAAGRMGETVCEAVEGADDMELAGRADPALGTDARRRPRRRRRRRRLHDPDDGARRTSASACDAGVHAVVGTTGFDLEELREARAGRRTAAGRNVLRRPELRDRRGADDGGRPADRRRTCPRCEIVELHHDRKLDAPSGTAKRTAELIADGGRQRPRADPLGAPARARRPPGGHLRRRGPDAHDPPRLDRPQLVHARRRCSRCRRVGRARPSRFTVGLETLCCRVPQAARMSDDLARMDATAQAELVRSGEATPDGAGRRRDRAHRGGQPGAQRGHPRRCSTRAREAAAGDAARRPVPGVPFLLKDLGAALAGEPLHLGMQLLKDADFRAPVDTYLAERFRAAGFVTIGKTNTPELGILPTTEPDGLRRDAQPLGHRPLDRRLERRLGARRSRRGWSRSPTPTTAAARSASRPADCGLVGLKPTRQRITEGPLIGDNMSGLTVELVRVAVGPRHRRDPRRRPRPGARRPLRRARRPSGPTSTSSTTDPGQLRIGAHRPSPSPTRSTPAAGASSRARRGASCSSRSATASRTGSIWRRSPTIDVVPSFMIRWAAGQAATPGAARRRPGPRDRRRRRRAADLGAGRDRAASARGADYLVAVGMHQVLSRMIAGLATSSATTCC